MIYKTTIQNWFREKVKKTDFHDLYQAMETGNAARM